MMSNRIRRSVLALGVFSLVNVGLAALAQTDDPATAADPAAAAQAASDPDWRATLQPSDTAAADPNPAIEELGNQRYRIGSIELDRQLPVTR